jgi:hypothetical protein
LFQKKIACKKKGIKRRTIKSFCLIISDSE